MLRQIAQLLAAKQAIGACCNASSTSGSQAAAASTSSTASASLRSAFSGCGYGRAYSSTAGGGESRSVLGGGLPHQGSVLEGAAEQRLARIKAGSDHAAGGSGDGAAHGGHAAQKGIVRRALGWLGRGILLGSAGTGIAAGYYTYRYDLGELETIVRETKAKEENAFLGSKL